jgi:hypothetical protein
MDYNQSFASTYDVPTKGRHTQNHSGTNTKNATVAAVESQKYNQYFFRSLFDVVIV